MSTKKVTGATFAELVAHAQGVRNAAAGPVVEGDPATYGTIDRLLDVLRAMRDALAGGGMFEHERGALALQWFEHEVAPLVEQLGAGELRADMVRQLAKWARSIGRKSGHAIHVESADVVLRPGESRSLAFQAPDHGFDDTLVIFHVGETHQQAPDISGLWVDAVSVGGMPCYGDALPMAAVIAPAERRGSVTIRTAGLGPGGEIRVVLRDASVAPQTTGRRITVALAGRVP
jgi:hypothetical protein